MQAPEGEHLEFKEARSSFEFEDAVKYCCALANEKGGRLVLGVSDRRPRHVVGTAAFQELARTRLGLVERLHLRIEVEEIPTPEGRVLVFEAPSRPVGVPIQYRGTFWMRAGESLVPMTTDHIAQILAEAHPDYSARVCEGAIFSDLDETCMGVFRKKWAEKSRNPNLEDLPVERLLEDAELLVDGGVTYAALVLLGTSRALGRHLAQSEMIFEYRSTDASISYQQRKEYRQGFLSFHDELWETIGLRNDVFSYQEGLFRREIRAFNESGVREAILNAVSHRDYRLPGSTFVRQWPSRIEIVSPGGFPPDITPENVLFRQSPRNRRIAEALARCGLVERSGQGADRMFETSIREGKRPPSFEGSDAYQVAVTLDGRVHEQGFVAYLRRLDEERPGTILVEDLVVLDAVHRKLPVPDALRSRVDGLVEAGALERIGRGRVGLSKRFYSFLGRPAEYTRRRGLHRSSEKALLLQHLQLKGEDGAPLRELCGVLPNRTSRQVQDLLRELKREGKAHTRGRTRSGLWFEGAASEPITGEPHES